MRPSVVEKAKQLWEDNPPTPPDEERAKALRTLFGPVKIRQPKEKKK